MFLKVVERNCKLLFHISRYQLLLQSDSCDESKSFVIKIARVREDKNIAKNCLGKKISLNVSDMKL